MQCDLSCVTYKRMPFLLRDLGDAPLMWIILAESNRHSAPPVQ